nr:hypothetical protein CFP56_44910 [Quercus suber]
MTRRNRPVSTTPSLYTVAGTNQLSLHSSNLRQPPHLSRRRPITATVSLSLPTAKPGKASSSTVKIPKVIERKSLLSLRPISSQSQKYLLVFFSLRMENQSALCIRLHKNCLSVFFGCELGCSTIQHDIAALFLWASCFLRVLEDEQQYRYSA